MYTLPYSSSLTSAIRCRHSQP